MIFAMCLKYYFSSTFHPRLFQVEQDQVWSITANPDEDLAVGQAC